MIPHRVIPCLPDCEGQATGDAAACKCAERDAMAYDAEMEARVDRLRDAQADAAYEQRERDRARAT